MGLVHVPKDLSERTHTQIFARELLSSFSFIYWPPVVRIRERETLPAYTKEMYNSSRGNNCYFYIRRHIVLGLEPFALHPRTVCLLLARVNGKCSRDVCTRIARIIPEEYYVLFVRNGGKKKSSTNDDEFHPRKNKYRSFTAYKTTAPVSSRVRRNISRGYWTPNPITGPKKNPYKRARRYYFNIFSDVRATFVREFIYAIQSHRRKVMNDW